MSAHCQEPAIPPCAAQNATVESREGGTIHTIASQPTSDSISSELPDRLSSLTTASGSFDDALWGNLPTSEGEERTGNSLVERAHATQHPRRELQIDQHADEFLPEHNNPFICARKLDFLNTVECLQEHPEDEMFAVQSDRLHTSKRTKQPRWRATPTFCESTAIETRIDSRDIGNEDADWCDPVTESDHEDSIGPTIDQILMESDSDSSEQRTFQDELKKYRSPCNQPHSIASTDLRTRLENDSGTRIVLSTDDAKRIDMHVQSTAAAFDAELESIANIDTPKIDSTRRWECDGFEDIDEQRCLSAEHLENAIQINRSKSLSSWGESVSKSLSKGDLKVSSISSLISSLSNHCGVHDGPTSLFIQEFRHAGDERRKDRAAATRVVTVNALREQGDSFNDVPYSRLFLSHSGDGRENPCDDSKNSKRPVTAPIFPGQDSHSHVDFMSTRSISMKASEIENDLVRLVESMQSQLADQNTSLVGTIEEEPSETHMFPDISPSKTNAIEVTRIKREGRLNGYKEQNEVMKREKKYLLSLIEGLWSQILAQQQEMDSLRQKDRNLERETTVSSWERRIKHGVRMSSLQTVSSKSCERHVEEDHGIHSWGAAARRRTLKSKWASEDSQTSIERRSYCVGRNPQVDQLLAEEDSCGSEYVIESNKSCSTDGRSGASIKTSVICPNDTDEIEAKLVVPSRNCHGK